MKDKVSTVMGSFGRLSAGAFSRSVSSHSFREPSVLFHLGGAELIMTMGDRVLPFRPGEMLLIEPWTSHARTVTSNESSKLVMLLIEPSWLDPGANGDPGFDFGFRQNLATIEPDMREQLDALSALMFDQPMARLETIQMKIEQLIELIHIRHNIRRHHGHRRSSIDSRVQQAFESLRSSAIQGVKIESLAAGSGMSRSHFFRQFKRSIGVSPQHVIDQERIAYSLKALGSSSGVMLSKLSAELGFSAPAHFTRFFVQHLGCTPSQFRRSLLVL